MSIIEWSFQVFQSWAWVLLPLFYIAIGFVVILETRNPSKALAYILLIILIPPVGILVFFFFGRDIRKRKMFTLKGNEDRERLRKYWLARKEEISQVEQELEDKLGGLSEPVRMLHSRRQSVLTTGNKVEFLVNGEGKFPTLIDALKEARHHIHLEYYQLSDDEVGNQIVEILLEKAREGVEIRVIADHVGSSDIGSIPKRLEELDCHCKFFQPVRFTSLASANYRDHRKIVVIDALIAFVGGLNVNDRYWNTGKFPLYWRDSHMRVEGPAVDNLQFQFLLSWEFVGGEPFSLGKPYFGQAKKNEGGCPIITAPSGPDSMRPYALDCMVSAIHEARKHVRITNPYFLPPDSLSMAMEIAASSGIQVDLIIPGKSDSWIVQNASRSYLMPLLRAGVNIYFYDRGFVHAKTMTVDGKLTTIGTVNLDERSFFINFEIMALVYDEEFTAKVDAAFIDDLKYCTQIDPGAWAQRPVLERAVDSMCRLMTPLL